MQDDPIWRAYAPPAAVTSEDEDVAELKAATRAEGRRQALRLLGLGAAMAGAGAFVLWRVAVYEAAMNRFAVKATAVGAGLAVSGVVFVLVALVIALRS